MLQCRSSDEDWLGWMNVGGAQAAVSQRATERAEAAARPLNARNG